MRDARAHGSPIRITAPAKVNLFFSIVGRRADGYHDVHTILQAIGLRDRLEFWHTRGSITLECSDPRVPCDESNLCVKAAQMMQRLARREAGVHIRLRKSIPPEAGLGGGSSDAAATLLALNRLWRLNLPMKRLASIAARLGSDVPFFLYGGTAFAAGRGERVLSMPTRRKRLWFVLLKPDYGVSTAWAYREWDRVRARPGGALEKAIDVVCLRDVDSLAQALHNDLEKVILASHPDIAGAKRDLARAGCLAALLCGSGSAVFGIAEDEQSARRAAAALRKSYAWVRVAPTAGSTDPPAGGPVSRS